MRSIRIPEANFRAEEWSRQAAASEFGAMQRIRLRLGLNVKAVVLNSGGRETNFFAGYCGKHGYFYGYPCGWDKLVSCPSCVAGAVGRPALRPEWPSPPSVEERVKKLGGAEFRSFLA